MTESFIWNYSKEESVLYWKILLQLDYSIFILRSTNSSRATHLLFSILFLWLWKHLRSPTGWLSGWKKIGLIIIREVSDKTFFKLFQKCFTLKGLLSIFLNLKLEQKNLVLTVMLFFGLVCMNGYPISRAAGAMYQSACGNAIVKVSDVKLFNKNKNIFRGPA